MSRQLSIENISAGDHKQKDHDKKVSQLPETQESPNHPQREKKDKLVLYQNVSKSKNNLISKFKDPNDLKKTQPAFLDNNEDISLQDFPSSQRRSQDEEFKDSKRVSTLTRKTISNSSQDIQSKKAFPSSFAKPQISISTVGETKPRLSEKSTLQFI